MAASNEVQVLIEAPEDLNFLVYVDDTEIVMGQSKNSSPSPAGRKITSSTETNDDVYTLSGWIRPLCGGAEIDISDIVPRLKRTIARQKYTTDELITITDALVEMTNMIIKSASISRKGDSAQEIMITMTFEALNLSGELSQQDFSIGGIQV